MNFFSFHRSKQASTGNHHTSAGKPAARRAIVGELVSTKFGSLKAILALIVVSAALMTGCGGGGTSNVVTVQVSPQGTVQSPFPVIVTQSLTLTSIVSGTTNTNVTWTCTFTTTTVDSTGKPTTSSAAPCKAETGNIPANSASTTVVFTAPQAVPDPTTFPNLEVTITATSAADTKKTGTSVLFLNSGIIVTLTPATATVPTSVSSTKVSQFQFAATLTNDFQNKGVTWSLTQSTPTATNPPIPFPQLPTCSPACGTIDQNGLYAAPTAVPTTASLTLVATSKADTGRFALGTITIIAGGPITFNGISPTIAPQNGLFYDIYLDAPNVTSASTVTLTGSGPNPTVKTLNFASGQLKVVFPIPTSTVTNPPSTGARLRLSQDDLSAADTFTVTVADPAQTVTNGTGPFKFSVVPVRPTSVSSSPDSIVQNAQTNELDLIVNGGYFGEGGLVANASFQGTPVAKDSNIASTSRQIALLFPSDTANSSSPGLYSLLISRTKPPLPFENNPSVTDLAIFPDYQTTTPAVAGTINSGTGGALTNASAIDIDQRLGVAAVAVPGGNRVEFFKITAGSATPIGFANVNVPSGLSINYTLHTVAVVSFQDQAVKVFPIPTTPTGAIAPIATISLAGFIPTEQTPLPLPYSIGVDSDTNLAVVAYSSTANPTTAKVGFLLDLNTGDGRTCLSNPAQTALVPPCAFAQVTLNTGQFPQVAMLPHSHLAVVTPGGIGLANGVDVTKASASSTIANVSVTSGLVTVTTTAAHGLNPGNPGTVLILNIPKGVTNQTDFNGAFSVQSVINSTSFTYALNVTLNDSATGVTTGTNLSTAYYSPANISIGGLSQTTQGVAVNPITGLVAAADANASGTNGPQINLLNSLDQNFSSITFNANCTIYTTTTCTGAPELLGTTGVAFQPFVNSLVSYNAALNQLSVSNPVDLNRYAVQTLPSGTGTATLTPTVNGSTVSLPLFGGVAVDAATNQVLVTQSGSGSIVLVNLGPSASTALKAVQVSEVLVPSAAPSDPNTLGGIAGASFPQGTLTSTTNLTGVKIFGSGFAAGAVVRLDQTPIATPAPINDREIDVTIPASFLTVPHRFALDVVSAGVQSNASDFIVVQAVDMTKVCANAQPSSVAIADQIKLGSYHPIAVVSNSGCNSVSVIDIAAQLPTFDANGVFTGFVSNPAFASIPHTVAVGSGPQGVAVSPRFGLALVANNTAGTASVVNLLTNTLAVTDVTTGAGPIGVAINEGTGAALVANTGGNTVSEINLGLLFGATPATSLTATTIAVDTEPIAIAIDPDRGTNNQGLAVVTALALSSSLPRGVLDSVDIGAATPAKSTTAAPGSLTATPTGIVFDASISPALFYATSSGGNVIATFNPDNGASSTVHVGINPTSLALNPQTGGILTVNTISNTISIVDSLSSPFKTRKTFGIPGSPQLGVAIDQFLNLAVIVDQAHNRVLLFPMPN